MWARRRSTDWGRNSPSQGHHRKAGQGRVAKVVRASATAFEVRPQSPGNLGHVEYKRELVL